MLELREITGADGDENYLLSGLATTWSKWYEVNDRRGSYHEQVERGAFRDAVDGRDTVALRVEHAGHAAPIASTRGGSLRFTDDSAGLRLAATLPQS